MTQALRHLTLVALATVILPMDLYAYCVSATGNSGNTAQQKDYKIRYSHLPAGITANVAHRATERAAQLWNDYANAGSFRYTGVATFDDLPSTYEQCALQGKLHHLVVFEEEASFPYMALASNRCFYGGVSYFSVIYLPRKAHGGGDFAWTADPTGSSDLVRVLAHEFGHTMNIGHPSGSRAGVMANSASNIRDLHSYDTRCAMEEGGFRALKSYSRRHVGGAFDPVNAWSGTPYSGGWAVAKGTMGITWTPSWQYYSAAVIKQQLGTYSPFHAAFTKDLDTAETTTFYSDSYTSMPPLAAVWRETPQTDRVLHSSHLNYPTDGNSDGKNKMRVAWSANQWATQSSGDLTRCTTMTGFLTCSSTTPIYTGKRMAVAWDPVLEKSHTAWVHQNRSNNTSEHQIHVATSYVSNIVLPVPSIYSTQTAVAPGMACRDASGYNCIIAYISNLPAEQDRVRVVRFYGSSGATHYTANFESTTYPLPTSSATFNPIAAWHHSGYFWIAVRSMFANAPIRVFRSTTGTSWSLYGEYESSVVGPSAASYYLENNQLGWWAP